MSIEVLKGETLIKVKRGVDGDGDFIYFETGKGKKYKMNHKSVCCENVYIKDICGDLNDLIGNPITMAEETSNLKQRDGEYSDRVKWTFYKLATKRGYVTISWVGSDNGYYSVSVYFGEISTF